jgi:hypothetical protein
MYILCCVFPTFPLKGKTLANNSFSALRDSGNFIHENAVFSEGSLLSSVYGIVSKPCNIVNILLYFYF